MQTQQKHFKTGSKIQWKWLGRIIEGTIVEIFLKPVSKNIKGKIIKRNGSTENPAYLVQSTANNFALKLQSELLLVDEKKSPKMRPKMFSED